MRLLRIDIQGFAGLTGRVDLETGHGTVGLILERNEAGKSTLAAAVTAALFGLDGDRRHFRRSITDVERYRPWKGSEYGLRLSVEKNGEKLLIERDFDRGTVRVLSGVQDVSDRYLGGGNDRVGQTLTGLSAPQFHATCFVGQGAIVWDAPPEELPKALQAVADSQGGESTAASAITVLQTSLDKYSGVTLAGVGQVETEIKRCREKIAEHETALRDLERRREEQAQRLNRIASDEMQDRRTALERLVLDLRRARTDLVVQTDLLERDDRRRKELEDLDAELTKAADLLAAPVERLSSIPRLAREHGSVSDRLQQHEEAVAGLEAQRAARQQEIASLALTRAVSDTDLVELRSFERTLVESDQERALHESVLDDLKRDLAARGVVVEEALALAEQFGQLVEVDRRLLSKAGSSRMQSSRRRDEAQQRVAQAEHELQQVVREKNGRMRRGWILVALALVISVVAFLLSEQVPVPSVVLAIVPGVLGALGVFQLWSVSGGSSSAEQRARSRVESAVADVDAVGNEALDFEQDFANLASRLGLDPDQLEKRYERWCEIESSVGRLNVHRARSDAAAQKRARLEVEAAEFWTLFGDEVDLQDLPDRVSLLESAVAAHRALQSIEEALVREGKARDECRSRTTELESQLRDSLKVLGIVEPDLQSALKSADARSSEIQRLQTLRDSQRPALQAEIFAPERRAQHESKKKGREERIAELAPHMENALKAEGDFGARLARSLDQPLREEDYQQARDELDRGDHRRREDNRQLHADVLTFRREYERDAPPLRSQIAELQLALTRAEQFRDAVTLARDTLARIGKETHQVWAAEIGRHTNDLLQRMGSEVREIEFGDDLEYRLTRGSRMLTGVEARKMLSEGARDVVYLATRIATARFLGGGEGSLPLILDDPFANADDERLLVGLTTLIEAIAPEQQVLLLACQRSRYEWALAQLSHPDGIVLIDLDQDDTTPSRTF